MTNNVTNLQDAAAAIARLDTVTADDVEYLTIYETCVSVCVDNRWVSLVLHHFADGGLRSAFYDHGTGTAPLTYAQADLVEAAARPFPNPD